MKKKTDRTQNKKEEIANSITHGIGALLSIVALIVLVTIGTKNNDPWQIVSYSVYGTSLITLYLFSTLYHSITNKKAKKILKIFDHSSIYLLIAGTYTSITLTVMRGAWGWALFGIIWGAALLGIINSTFFKQKYKVFEFILYILMGWLVVIAIKPMMETIPTDSLIWLVVGGVCYTLGTVFYGLKRLYSHSIWHLFVLAGSISHFLGILSYSIT